MSSAETVGIEGIEVALHQMCQPLTVLQCRLELGMFQGEPEAMRTALMQGVRECQRLNDAVARMKQLVSEALVTDQAGSGEEGSAR